MAENGFRDVSALPDHGRGPIGQAAHGLLSAEAGNAAHSVHGPVIALAYNTMADAPGPPGYSVLDMLPQFWEAAHEDVHHFLALLTHAVRSLPAIDRNESEQGTDEPTPTRLDGMAMVFYGAALRPGANSAGAALAANLAEGFYRRGDIAASPAAERAPMAVAVARDGTAALLTAGQSRPGSAEPEITGESHQVGGALVSALNDLLAVFWSQMEEADRRSAK